jgi:hypothetical protein
MRAVRWSVIVAVELGIVLGVYLAYWLRGV